MAHAKNHAVMTLVAADPVQMNGDKPGTAANLRERIKPKSLAFGLIGRPHSDGVEREAQGSKSAGKMVHWAR
jgi:hypothetical protein